MQNGELAALIDRIRAGDEDGLSALYDATHRWVYGLVLRIVREPAIAEEVTLDFYLHVWERGADYAPDRGRVEAWLFTIARSRALDAVRRRATRSRHEVPTPDDFEITLADQPAPEEHVETGERDAQVACALGRLPGRQRRAIELAFFAGLTHYEIADVLDLPLGTIKTQIRLGMMKLRDLLVAFEGSR